MKKLQHTYDKHAADFGLRHARNTDPLEKLKAAIEVHLADPETTLIKGHYRGQAANLHYNSRSQNVVVTDSQE